MWKGLIVITNFDQMLREIREYPKKSVAIAVAHDQTVMEAAAEAKTARRGMYAGTFQNPWEYRKRPSNPMTAGTPGPAAMPMVGSVYYRSCAAARAAGAAPVRLGKPGYGRHLDRDGDGVGCE